MSSKAEPLVTQNTKLMKKTFITDPAWFPEEIIVDANGKKKKKLPKPAYTVAEASKFFFGKTPDWIRWLGKKSESNPHGFFVLDGVPLEDHRTDHNFRYYTLADIERMAHALADNGAIDGGTCEAVILMVESSCKIYGYL